VSSVEWRSGASIRAASRRAERTQSDFILAISNISLQRKRACF
jgi:hypothetical protein